MNYHFIAIAGATMHNLAIALSKSGHHVTGSDDEIFEPSRSRLQAYGLLPPTEGWDASRIHEKIDAVILGMHAREDNPELIRSRELGLQIHSFPSFLYEHARDKQRIVIAGSHGKTTITSMIIHVLERQGVKFDFMVGAIVDGFDVMVRLSDDTELMILEGDEYLTSALDPRPKFHLYQPHVAVLSGIAWDHMNVFHSFENYIEQFRIFVSMLPADGKLFFSSEDSELAGLIEEFPNLDASGYEVLEHEVQDDGSISLWGDSKFIPASFFGRHNLLNAEAARLVCQHIGIGRQAFVEALADFKGASKRLELIYKDERLLIFRDFAHAPSKVRATVEAVHDRFPGWEICTVLELHTYSSLNRDFLPQYKDTLEQSDLAAVYLNPHAFEMKRLPMIESEEVIRCFDKPSITILNSGEETESYFRQKSKPGQVWLFMSSGNFGGLDLNTLNRIE